MTIAYKVPILWAFYCHYDNGYDNDNKIAQWSVVIIVINVIMDNMIPYLWGF